MAMEMAVAGTDHPGLAEVVEHEVHGLLSPMGDAEALAASIARFAGEDGLAARLGSAGRARVEQMFDLDRNVARLVELFDRMQAERVVT